MQFDAAQADLSENGNTCSPSSELERDGLQSDDAGQHTSPIYVHQDTEHHVGGLVKDTGTSRLASEDM